MLDAERRGALRPGGTVVEGTAGNTGIGLAHVCNARGYRCVIVMPDNQSPEKYALIEALGAQVQRVKAVPYSDPNHYQKVAGRMAGEMPNAIWANQFDNTGQSPRARGDHRPGDLGADRRPHRRLRGRQRHRRHARRGVGVPEVAAAGGAHRARRSARQRPV